MEILCLHSPQERGDHKLFGPVRGENACRGRSLQQDNPGEPKEESLPSASLNQKIRQ